MTESIVLTRIWVTVINVEFTILSLKTWRADTLIGPNEISAGSSILAGLAQTFIDFLLAIASKVSIRTDAFMAVSNISTMAFILANLVTGDTPEISSNLA